MAQTAADPLAETFVAMGATRIYRVMGDSLTGLTDALHRQVTIELIHGLNGETFTGCFRKCRHSTGVCSSWHHEFADHSTRRPSGATEV
jgi:pyruvate dehydrogenase (quinone)